MKKIVSALLLSMVAQFAAAVPINLVQNGDFEMAVGGPGEVPMWTYSGGDSYFGVDADYIGSPMARPGQVFYDGAASNIGVLSQAVATTAGTSYTLEFDLQRYAWSPEGVSNLSAVYFGAGAVFFEEDTHGDWTHFTITGLVAGPGTSTLLRFENLNEFDFNQLDNISLVAIDDDDPTDVSEPATPLTMLAAAGAIALLRRRRRA